MLGPTSSEILRDDARPYFVWWTDETTADLRRHLASEVPAERAYWMGALLREANTRDVWPFVTPDAVRRDWALVARHLGRARAMWAWLLRIDA